jgi:hypothetical protein
MENHNLKKLGSREVMFKNWNGNMKRKGLLVLVLLILPGFLVACSLGRESISEEKVKTIVLNKLVDRFDEEFEIKDVHYEPSTEEYTISAQNASNPELQYSFSIFKESITDPSKADGDFEGLYRVVVYERYRNALKQMVTNGIKRDLPQCELELVEFYPPESEDFKNPVFSNMNFNEYSDEYRDGTSYHLYLTSEEAYSKDYLSSHKQNLHSFLNDLEENHVKHIRLMVVFPNDLYIDSDLLDVETFQDYPLTELFSENSDKNPVIPGFDYGQWENSIQ